MKAVDLFSDTGRERIRKAIGVSEHLTSGEIRVYVDDHCKENVLDRAAFLFHELGMSKTDLRNGVLIYLAIQDHKFAIIGDAGIHAKVGDDFWNLVKEEMLNYFRDDRFLEGLEYAVLEAGKKLQAFFPRTEGDINELSDDIIFGNSDTE